jgi:hypothetical protein
LADDQYGPKIIENIGLQDFAPDPVTRVSDLFKFRSYFLTQFGPRYLWLIKLSVIEWPTLSAEEKKLHTALCASPFSPRTSLVLKLLSSTGFGKHSRTPPNLSAPFSKCSPLTMTPPPLVVLAPAPKEHMHGVRGGEHL